MRMSFSKINDLIYDDFFLNRTFNSPSMISFSKKEIEWLIKLLNLENTSRIIDVSCGSGRHLKAFSDLGFSPWGVDSSPACIRLAKENCPVISHKITQDDFLTFANSEKNVFDLVFIAGGSFGYDPSVTVNLEHLKSLLNLVSPQGYLVIQYLNKSWATSTFKKTVNFWIEDDLYYILDKRRLDGNLLNSEKIFIKKHDLFQKRYPDIITTFTESEIIKSVSSLTTQKNTIFEKNYLADSFSDAQFEECKSATPVLILKRIK